LAIKQ